MHLPHCSPEEGISFVGERLRAVGRHGLNLVTLARGWLVRFTSCTISSLQRHLPCREGPVVLLAFSERRPFEALVCHFHALHSATAGIYVYRLNCTRAPTDHHNTYERNILTKIASCYTRGVFGSYLRSYDPFANTPSR